MSLTKLRLRSLPLPALALRWRIALGLGTYVPERLYQAYGEELARRGYFIDPRTLRPVKVRSARP